MARSKQRTRKRKHRGTQGGTVKQSPRARGGSSRSKAKPQTAEERRLERLNRPPSWTRSIGMGVLTASFLFVAFMIFFKRDIGPAAAFAVLALTLYVPIFYFADSFKYQRHLRRMQKEREEAKGEGGLLMEVQMFTVGPVQENCFLISDETTKRALIVDPGDEAPRILEPIKSAGLEVEAILVTHTHFDHVGAVAPVAKATGAPVYVSEIERPVLADIMSFVPFAGIGPYESYEADHTLRGGEKLELAGFEIDVLYTPGHSPGHLTFSIPSESVIFSGDVLFQGSVGRVDLPGGDWGTLLASIEQLVTGLPADTTVYPGHMGITSLGAEQRTNPFLEELPATGA